MRFMLFATLLLGASSLAAQSFSFFRDITATNTGGTGLTDYQVLVELNTVNFNYSNMRADGFDMRFFDSTGAIPRDYYVETWNPAGTSLIWVELPTVPASGMVTFRMHYGDPAFGTDGSSFANTFPNAFISSGNTTLTGTQTVDWFEIQAADTITVGAGAIFAVNARRVIIAGTLDGTGAGNAGAAAGFVVGAGTGGGGVSPVSNSGSGGGAYGGDGGSGGFDAGDTPGVGGTAFGSATTVTIDLGSAGGSGGGTAGFGGSGGAGIDIRGFMVTVTGTILADGTIGGDAGQCGGGGSGGGILIGGFDVSVTGTLSANGGDGGPGTSTANDSGGGGGGGRIKIFHENTVTNTATLSVVEGQGGPNGGAGPGQDGQPGTTNAALDTTVVDEVSNAIGSEQVFTPTAPTITSTAPTTATTGTAYTYTVTATGTSPITFSIAGSLPTGIVWNGTDTLSGTPSVAGTFGPITITASNGVAPNDTEVFSIVVTTPMPEIQIDDPNSNDVADNSVITVYAAVVGVASTGTFTINNPGQLDLTISAFTDTLAVNCTLANTAPGATIAAAGSDTFGISIMPTVAGPFSFTLVITNNDADEGTFNINFSGVAKLVADAEIAVLDPAQIDIVNGSTIAQTNTGTATFNRLFTIQNQGGMPLTLSGAPVVVAGQTNCSVVVTQPASSALGAAATFLPTEETFNLAITPTAAGAFSFTVTLASNDADEATFTFTYNGNTAVGGGGSSGGGGGGDDDGGCSIVGNGTNWMPLAGLLVFMAVALRKRRARA